MASFRKLCAIAAISSFLTTAASGYYHYVHYASRTSPFTPAYEKFDLNALPNKTVYFFIADPGPSQFAAGDSATSLTSQIRAAAKVWNDVDSSDLRVAYGGTAAPFVPQMTPGIDVVFEEMPPGILAMGTPLRRGDLTFSGPSPFVPIARSIVKFPMDLSQRPSYSDAFFMTAVHEFGHALGLQHSMASSTMSTEVTRGTSKARPLDFDDVAAISVLYPGASFKAYTGTVSGRVNLAGQGVNLASVVAISANGPAIGALTNPDGTYRIEGIPSGNYYIYVHPLPPPSSVEVSPANINSQWAPDGMQSFPFSVSFETQFYPGVKDWQMAAAIPVYPGQSQDGVNFNVQRNAQPSVYSVQTFGYPGGYGVKPAYINFNGGRQLIAVSGVGLIANGVPAPGLGVSVLGNLSNLLPGSPRAYTADFILIDFLQPQPAPPDGARHLVFSLNDDIHVLPNAFQAVRRQPPTIISLTPSLDQFGRPALFTAGSNLGADTKIWFDGQPAPILEVLQQGLTVAPPVAPAGHRATLVALNGDGQTSMFTQAAAPVVYQYDAPPDAPAIAVSPNSVAAGTESLIEISGIGTAFAEGQTVLTFGTSDIVVRRSWVVGPTKILANVQVAPNAPAAYLAVAVTTGLRSVNQQFALQVQGPGSRQFYISSTPWNSTWSNNAVVANSTVTLQVPNLTSTAIFSGVSMTFGEVSVTNFNALPGSVTFTVPNLPSGPAVFRLQAGGDQAAIVLPVDLPPATIVSLTMNGLPVDNSRGLRYGDTVSALVAGFGDLGAQLAPGRVQVTLAGVPQPVNAVTEVSSNPVLYQVQFTVTQTQPGTQPLLVMIDGKSSSPLSVTVR